jgi:hypothetical protein
MGSGQESVVVINADEAVSHGRVVAVMDELRAIEGATWELRRSSRNERQWGMGQGIGCKVHDTWQSHSP